MYLRVRREKLTTLFIKRGKITDPGGKVLPYGFTLAGKKGIASLCSEGCIV